MNRINTIQYQSLKKIDNNQSNEIPNKIEIGLPQQDRIKYTFKLNDPLKKVRMRKYQKAYLKQRSKLNKNDLSEQNEVQIKTKKQIIQQIRQMQKNFVALRKFDFITSRIKNKFNIHTNNSIDNLQKNNTYFDRKTAQIKYRSLELPPLNKQSPNQPQQKHNNIKSTKLNQSTKKIKTLLSQKIRQRILNDISTHNAQNIKQDIQLTRQANQAIWIDKFSEIKNLIKKNELKKEEKYKNELASRFMNPYSIYLSLNKIQKKLVKQTFLNHIVTQQKY